jgi:hypothetical protein
MPSESLATELLKRLPLLDWQNASQRRVAAFFPTFEAKIDPLIRRFYDHLLSRPDVARILRKVDIPGLIPAQRAHWLKLFRCEFSEEYVSHARAIGQAHYHNQIPVYAYIGSYNYMLTLILEVASQNVRGFDLAPLLADISRLVCLDMELALAAYVREHWTDTNRVAI